MAELTGELMGDILKLITEGSIGFGSFQLPTLAFMGLPFVLGLIIGILIKKAIKIAIVLLAAMGALMYFGVLSFSDLKVGAANLWDMYGTEAQQYAAMLVGMLPLGIGLVIGLIVGLKFG